MKKKYYILVIIAMLFVGINGVSAKTCYYMTDDQKTKMVLEVTQKNNGRYKESVIINQDGRKITSNDENIDNWDSNKTEEGLKVSSLNGNKTGKCPKYLILKTNSKGKNYEVYGFNSLSKAEEFNNWMNNNGAKAWGITKYQNEQGEAYTKEDYYSSFVTSDIVDPNYEITCDDLFGDANDENSIAYIIDMILKYVRIIVPILIIVLGSIDLGKAVIAGKEDEMKMAQKTFIKRIFMGVLIFFVPVIVELVMWLADIVWEAQGYVSCEFN